MRIATLSVLASATFAAAASAQSMLPPPIADAEAYKVDSGIVKLGGGVPAPAVVFAHDVHREGVAWLRLHFSDIVLGPESGIRLTSLHDGSTQWLDRDAVRDWRHRSAYFNGDTVRFEIVAAPGTSNRVVLEMITFQDGAFEGDGGCGICGPDDRDLTSDDAVGRLMPAGCTSTIYSDQSCVVTAGHCADGGGADVMQFRVPPSNPDCSLVHPPADEQFPIIDQVFENAGPGNDWAVLRAGTNDSGQTPWQRYGVLAPISHDPVTLGDTFVSIGYGTDSQCVRNQVEQVSTGTVTGTTATVYYHDADTTFGSSGTGLRNVAGEIVGIATHCGCPTNTAQRIDAIDFRDARDDICGCLGDVNLDGEVGVIDLLKVLGQWGLTGEQSADVNNDEVVDIADLLIVLAEWGPC